MLNPFLTKVAVREYTHRWLDRRFVLVVHAKYEMTAIGVLSIAGLPMSDVRSWGKEVSSKMRTYVAPESKDRLRSIIQAWWEHPTADLYI